MSYLGIDIGTSASKAVVFDANGNELASASREYSLLQHPGWAELDSNAVANCCFEIIKEVASKTSNDPIQALAISCQGEAFTAIDKNGNALCNAMVSSDARAKDIAKTWSEKFGKKKLYEITGHTAHPLFTLFKLLWIKEHTPEVWKAADKFLCFEDFLLFKLGVTPAISYSLAGRTMLFDIRKEQWSEEILNAIGLDKSKLAVPMPSGKIAGKIPSSIASTLGLSSDVLVVAGGHDQCCGAMGAGINKAGTAMYALGTVECAAAVFDRPILSEELFNNNLCTYHHTAAGEYISLGYSLTGGNLLKWCKDELALPATSGQDVYELMMNSFPEQPTSLLALPYFTPGGTPYFETDLGGAILGLRLNTSRGEIIKALVEGVTLEMRLNLDLMERSGIRIEQLNMIGGGTKNERVVQLKADVLGKPVLVMKVSEAGCLSAAMLACAAHTGEGIDNLMKWIKTGGVITPDESKAKAYNDKYNAYTKLYPTLKTLVE